MPNLFIPSRWLAAGLAFACVLSGCNRAPEDRPAEPPRPSRKRVPQTLPVIELNRERLMASARAGGDYLVNMQRDDGSFYYTYDAVTDRAKTNEYNIVRHAGTTFSLFDLYAVTKEPGYLEAANLGMAFLKTRFRPAAVSNAVYVLDNDGKAKLGANGLALLALARQIELDPSSADRTAATQLANQIVAMQQPDGSFISYHPIIGDEPEGDVSIYYPGEAILGLVEFYRVGSKDPMLVSVAHLGAEYLIKSQREMPELPPDAWLMQALEALHKHRAEPKYIEHAIAVAESMIAQQYDSEAPERFIGGFGPLEPRVTPAAARSEGILSAYRLARAAGDPRAAKLAAALKASARFQIAHQFTREDASWLPAAETALGGFRGSLSSTRVRIDYVQHNISALLGLAQLWDSLDHGAATNAVAGGASTDTADRR